MYHASFARSATPRRASPPHLRVAGRLESSREGPRRSRDTCVISRRARADAPPRLSRADASIRPSALDEMRSFPDDAQNTLDASQMRRAGKPTVTTKRGALSTMARLADQEARHKNVLRPKGTSSYDPKTREMRRLSVVVEKLALEQRESLAAESAAADVFSKVSDRVAVLEKAFGDLADAVSDELTAARLERQKWSADLDVIRGVVDACLVLAH